MEELLGAGASGMVVGAKHVWLRYSVSLKILAGYTDVQIQALERQMDRARTAARLRGEHIARIRDIGITQDKMPYVATEGLEGRTLEAELAERTKLPVTEAVRWILQACEGLAEAHAIDLAHGDLKPANLFLADTEDGDRVLKILDYGMASPIESIGDAGASAWFASPAYLAPEQIQDPTNVDARADIWALGVILYQLISGHLPFTADTVSGMLVAVVMDEPGLLTDAPYELARIVHRCLAKSPSKRPADVATLARELTRFAGDESYAHVVERTKAALATPPPEVPAAFDPEEEALGIVASTPAIPLVRRREKEHAWDEPTALSKRVLGDRRRTRARRIALGAVGFFTLLALASAATFANGASPPAFGEDDAVVVPPRAAFEPPAFVPPTMLLTPPHAQAPASLSRSSPKQAHASRVAWHRRSESASPLPKPPSKERRDPPGRSATPGPVLPTPSRDVSYLRNLLPDRR